MKTCPQCGAKTFDDMSTCFGCLYVFPNPAKTNVIPFVPKQSPSVSIAPVSSSIRLTVLSPQGKATTFEFKKDSISIGRSQDSDIVLSDPKVSRAHLRISRNGEGELQVEDTGATNPALINGLPLGRIEPFKASSVIDVQGTLIMLAS